ncbi:hypothetical protein [Streptomyces sp. BBFR109]|uniref:hypothetical protein n=1 Tax=Streptomyces sp. BBFR109 TaxID=3448172 RepID=UPI003F7704AB
MAKADVASIEKNLMTLIQDEGLTPQRLALHGEQILSFMPESDPKLAMNVIVITAETVEGELGTALRNALAIGYEEGTNLSQRRATLIASGDFPNISEATLRRWERKGITLLARSLAKESFDDQEAQFLKQIGGLKRDEFEQVRLMRLGMHDVRTQLAQQTELLREISESLKLLVERQD